MSLGLVLVLMALAFGGGWLVRGDYEETERMIRLLDDLWREHELLRTRGKK